MNVTYLIGNGFDIGIGLHTDFKSFLTYYVDVPSPSSIIADFKEKIKQDTIELWADFEKCFGKYIANFNEETIDNYVEVYENVLSELNNYLNSENERFSDDISKEEQKIINWLNLTELANIGFRPAVIGEFYSYTRYNADDLDVTYNFLSFNYTDTFDKIIKKISSKTSGTIYSTTYRGNSYYRRIGKLIHVHGKLNENMLMGVNDINQLPFSGSLPDRIKRRVIKPQKNKRIGYRIDETAARFVNESTIICLYGMSIGETDAIWWERIGSWLLSRKENELIYFVYDKDVQKETVYGIDQTIDAEEKYCEKLLNSLKVPKEKWENVKKRIIVIINSNFMQMNKAKELSTSQERNL